MRDASEILTEKLYERDSYIREFDAQAVRVSGRDVVLNRTAFFPEEGGQSPDLGVLGGTAVMDVQIRDGEIHHILTEEPSFEEGQTVHGVLDWERRYSNMQQHSGEHLLSGAIYHTYGYENTGFHLSDAEVTLDVSGELDAGQLMELEAEVNRGIRENVAVRIYMTGPAEREGMAYRSKLDLPGEVRIVEFPGLDACACCAPHVKATGEIGMLKITGFMRWKGGVRINIACGSRAFALFREEHELLHKTARFLTTSPDKLYEQTVRDKEEIRRLKQDIRAVSARLLDVMIEAYPSDEENVILFTEGIETTALREAANRVTGRRGGCAALFCGTEADGYSYIIASESMDVRPLSNRLKEMLNAKGGGKPGMVQGTVKACEAAIREALSGIL